MFTDERTPRRIREERGDLPAVAHVEREAGRLIWERENHGEQEWARLLGEKLTTYALRAFQDDHHAENTQIFVQSVQVQLAELKRKPELMPHFVDGINEAMYYARLVKDRPRGIMEDPIE